MHTLTSAVNLATLPARAGLFAGGLVVAAAWAATSGKRLFPVVDLGDGSDWFIDVEDR